MTLAQDKFRNEIAYVMPSKLQSMLNPQKGMYRYVMYSSLVFTLTEDDGSELSPGLLSPEEPEELCDK